MAITPFYRERGNGYPDSIGEKVVGQNFFEHQLYSLRTRIESDPVYAEYTNRFGTILGYRNVPQGDKISIEMVVRRVSESDPNTNYQSFETLSPPWLQNLVDKWIDVYPEYAVVLSDQYPIEGVPPWWLAEIMPRLDITDIVQETWFFEDNRKAENYDFFYQGGSIFIRLVDENQDNRGPYSATENDYLKTGEKTIKRGEYSYGDHSEFQTRYIKLHVKLYYHMIKLYNRGVICLEKSSSMISKWKLGALVEGANLYEPVWSDTRLTHYDGTVNLLKRQFLDRRNQWDYQNVYYQVGLNRVLKHMVASYLRGKDKVAIFYDSILSVPISDYEEAVEVANEIDNIKDVAGGSVIPSVYREGKGSGYLPHVVYVDMSMMKIIRSFDTDIKLKVVPSVMKKEDLNLFLKEALEGIIPAKTELNKIIDSNPEILVQ